MSWLRDAFLQDTLNRYTRRTVERVEAEFAQSMRPAVMTAPVPGPTLPAKPAPTALVRTMDPEALARYQALSTQIGWSPTVLVNESLRAWFLDHDWPILDFASVVLYMEAMVARLNHDDGRTVRDNRWRWVWAPLRGQRDALRWRDFKADERLTPYDLPIPERVLARVATLDQAFGDRVCFQVTQIGHRPTVDPFICVSAREFGSTPFVFDVWDEPGFQG